MFKLIASITLSLVFALLVRESVVSWRSTDLPTPLPANAEKKQVKSRPQNAGAPVKFYPVVASPMPDLKKGYLFNEERFLLDENAVAEGTEDSAGGTELAVDMDTVFYSGSIIIGDLRKGLISYSAPKAPAVKKVKTRKKRAAKIKKTKYAQLVAGDTVSGYKVVSVEPDRIVFEKGTEKIEKMLNDTAKVRIAPPAPPKKKVKRKTAVKKTTSKRVKLDRAKQGTRTVTSPRTRSSTKRSVPDKKIQIPGLPGRR